MSGKQASYRQVLALFIEKIPKDKGWWYRLPSRVSPLQDGKPLPFDAILPQMGTLFGITEFAMWVILYGMGCYRKLGDGFVINRQGWDALMAQFKVEESVEVSQSRVDGTRVYYIILDWGFQKTSLQPFGRSTKIANLKNTQPLSVAVSL